MFSINIENYRSFFIDSGAYALQFEIDRQRATGLIAYMSLQVTIAKIFECIQR